MSRVRGFTEDSLKKLQSKGITISNDNGFKSKKSLGVKSPKRIHYGATNNRINGIFIPYNVPSSKNSRQLFVKRDKFGSPIVGPGGKIAIGNTKSKQCSEYLSFTKSYYEWLKADFKKQLEGKQKPYYIAYQLHRKTKSRFDHHNIIQIVADLMVANGWIEDDDADTVIFIPVKYTINSEHPGITLQVQ